MSKDKRKARSVEDSEDYKEVSEKKLIVERMVPITEAEILGMSIIKDRSDILLEFGYSKNDNSNIAIIDTRKKLPMKMAKDLYEKLKKHFEGNEENISEE
ncbi:TPA: hypothetical protein R7Q74_002657 [Acinetobacter baumannii]|nr:hypothetical protein [Acinetobacter baumannii]HEE6163281.1 hypothetical protein [Acinetobacter baumannii]